MQGISVFKSWTDGWRGEKGGWWRLVITMAAYVAGIAAGGLAVVLPIQSRMEELRALPEWQKDVLEAAPLAAGCLAGLLLFFLAKSLLSRGRPGAFAAPGARAGALPAVISGVLWLALTAGAGLWLGELQSLEARLAAFTPAAFASLAGALFLAILIQASSEEIVFRGYLLPRLSVWLGPVLAAALSGLIFLGLHFQPGLWGALMIASFGVVFAIATIRTGSVMPALGAHVANNFFEYLFRPDVTNASLGPKEFIATAAGLTVWLIFVFVALSPKRSR